MSLSILEYGDGRFHLFHDDREVGWLEGRTIAFFDFEDADAAQRGAEVAYDALSVWLARQRRTDAPPRRGRALGTRHDERGVVLTLAGLPIGRIRGPGASTSMHGFELYLPPRLGSSLTAAHVIDQALTRHREFRQLVAPAPPGGSEIYA